MSTPRRILIFDGLNLLIRNWCVNPTMDVNGNPVGGIVGSLRSIKSVIREVKPTAVVVAWDGKGGSTKRRGVYAEYKAGRKPRVNRELGDHETVDESRQNLQRQYAKLREYLSYLGVAQVEIEGCEADDVIGYLCSGPYHEIDKVVVSTDRDMLQLVDRHTLVYSPTKKEYYSTKVFVEKVGLRSENFIYMKSICGDDSDNIKGVKGVGEKGVTKIFPFLAERASSLEEIKTYAEEHKKESQKLRSILDQWDLICSNLALMQLTSPIISAQSTRSIRYALRPDSFRFNASDLKLLFIKDGIQLVDSDFFGVFQEYRLRHDKEEPLNDDDARDDD